MGIKKNQPVMIKLKFTTKCANCGELLIAGDQALYCPAGSVSAAAEVYCVDCAGEIDE